MLGKQIAALSLSGLLLFSGAVTAANADEATPIDTIYRVGYGPDVRKVCLLYTSPSPRD